MNDYSYIFNMWRHCKNKGILIKQHNEFENFRKFMYKLKC